LDSETDAVIENRVPADFGWEQIVQAPTTTRVTLWMSSTRNARVLTVRPLDGWSGGEVDPAVGCRRRVVSAGGFICG